MAVKADGTIYINSAIETDGFESGSKELESAVRSLTNEISGMGDKAKLALQKQADAFAKQNRMVALQKDKLEELEKEYDDLKNTELPTDEFAEITQQIDNETKKLNRLKQIQEEFLNTGGKTTADAYKKRQLQIEELTKSIKYAKGEQEELLKSGQAYKAPDTSGIEQKIAAEQKKLIQMNNSLGTSYEYLKMKVNSYASNNNMLNKSQNKVLATFSKLKVRIKQTAKAMMGLNKQTKGTRMSLSRMLGMSLLFSTVFKVLSSVTTGMTEGMKNVAQYSNSTNQSISGLISALTRLKNSFAAAFSPMLTVAVPVFTSFINMLSRVINYIGMFIAALTGQATVIKATAVQEDYAASLNESADNAKKAEKATNSYLSGLDEIQRYDSGSSINTGQTEQGYTPPSPSEMFETIKVEDSFKSMAEKVKSILSKIFQPFKQAWNTEGINTINAAKTAFANLRDLAQSVGISIMEVWTNGTGTETLGIILQIAQNVLWIIGNLAQKFKEAWDTNYVGRDIIQAIANILKSVFDFINRIATATSNWAAQINFHPLLVAIKDVITNMQPVIEEIGNFLEYIYTTYILPMCTYLIEEALPFILEQVSNLFTFLSENQWIIEAVGAALLGAFAAAIIVPAITTIITAITGIITTIQGAGGLIPAIGMLMSSGGLLTIVIAGVITAGILLIENWDKIKEAAEKLKDWLIEKTRKMYEDVTGFFSKMKNKISDYVQKLKDYLKQKWEDIKKKATEIWENIKTTVVDTVNTLKTNATQKITELKNKVVDAWNNIKTTAVEKWEAIKSKILGFAETIKTGVGDAFQTLKDTVQEIFETLVDVLKAPINAVIGMINGLIYVINGFINKLNDVFTFEIGFELPKWMGGGSYKYRHTMNIPNINTIPYLATGAVIPPNAPFMAVLGDQKNGTNLEMPEDLLRKILREENGGNKGGTYHFVGQINGRILFEEVIEEGREYMMQTGRNPFELSRG